MNKLLSTGSIITAALVALALVGGGAYLGFYKKSIKAYTINRQARGAYYEGNYEEAYRRLTHLVDSLSFHPLPAELNTAHAGYRFARQDSATKASRDVAMQQMPLDSTTRNAILKTLNDTGAGARYRNVAAEASKGPLASIAANQLGVIAFRLRSAEDNAQETAAFTEALEYFKAALKADPENEAARYNYELIRRRIDYPEMVMAKVRSLIRQQRYRQARQVLNRSLDDDYRMKSIYGDYIERLDNIITIDSLSRS